MATMPPTLSGLADGFYVQQQTTARSVAVQAQAAWSQMPTTGLRDQWKWWQSLTPLIADQIAVAQFTNAERAVDYVTFAALMQQAQDMDMPQVRPLAFVSPTDDVNEWLTHPMHHYTSNVLQGQVHSAAQTASLSTLVRMTTTLAQDAGREAVGVGVASSSTMTGYYRRLRSPSCDRCAVLAGAFYEWNEGFERHPRCDCIHVPAAEKYDDGGFDAAEAIRRGEVTGLTKGAYRAIVEEGADPAQVINATRKGSVYYTQMFGKKVQVTSSGNSTGLANLRLNGGKYRVERSNRLTPLEIYRQAGSDKELARQLLYRHAYIA